MLDVVSSLPRSLSSTSVVGVGAIFIIYILDIIIKFQRDVSTMDTAIIVEFLIIPIYILA
jgi:hypothetical protein